MGVGLNQQADMPQPMHSSMPVTHKTLPVVGVCDNPISMGATTKQTYGLVMV